MTTAFAAVEKGDVKKLQSLLSSNKQLLKSKKDGMTLLMVAAVQGHTEIAELLLKHNAPVNETNHDGRTAVFLAASNGNYETVKLLTTNPIVKIDGKDRYGDSILMAPARSGFSIIVQHLLEYSNAKPNIQDKDGWTPLMVAASRGQKDVVETLLANNASVSLVSFEDCTTAMKEAVKGGHIEVVQMLATAEIKLDKLNDQLYKCKSAEEARELIKANVTVEQVKGNGRTPLMTHAERGNIDICEVLLDNNAQIDRQDRKGETAVMKACYHGKLSTVELLIKRKCILDIRTIETGWTALMFAVDHGHMRIVKALVLAGANIMLRNYDRHQSVLDMTEDKDEAMFEYLKGRSQANEMNQEISMTPFTNKLSLYFDKVKLSSPSRSRTPEVEEQPATVITQADKSKPQRTSKSGSAKRSSASHASPPSLSVTQPAEEDESTLEKELKTAREKVANLETRVQELTLRMTLEPTDEELAHLSLERMKEELLKAREMKRKMEKYATDAKQAAQRLSAENHKLKEQVTKEKHAHELHWKNVLREVEQKVDQASALEQLKSKGSLRTHEAGLMMAEAGAKAKRITELTTRTITAVDVQNLLFDKQDTSLKMDMFLLVICGLPTSGKTTMLNNFDMDAELLEQIRRSPHDLLGVKIHEFGYLKKALDPTPLWVSSTGKDILVFMMTLAIIKKCAHEKRSPTFSLDVSTSEMFNVTFHSDLLRDNLKFILERIKSLVPDLVRRTDKHMSVETLVTSRLSIFNCWDVGVCRAMYTVLPLLANVSKRLFLVNMLDLLRDGDDLFSHPILTGKDYGQNSYLMRQRSRLHYLIRIAGLTRETAKRVAEIIQTTVLVANVREDPKTEEETLEELLRNISTAIFQTADNVGIGPILHPDILAVDVSTKEGAQKVQQVIEGLIKQAEKHLEVDMPLNWMFFRTALYDHDKFYITKAELVPIAAECHIYKEEELCQFLNLFTHTASLLYFPDVFGDYVILHPRRFLEAVHKLFYPEKLVEEGHVKVLKKGLLCNVVAGKLWGKEAPLFMLLLCESGLAYDLKKLPHADKNLCDVCPKNKVTHCLYMPSLWVPDDRDATYTIGEDTSKSLFVTFNTEYIPTSLETTLIKYLIVALMQTPTQEQELSEDHTRQRPFQESKQESSRQSKCQFNIDFDFEESTFYCTILRLMPTPKSMYHSLVNAVVIYIISHGDVLEIKFEFEPFVGEPKRNKSFNVNDLYTYIYALLKNLVVETLGKVLVYFKDIRYQLAFPCPCSVSMQEQKTRRGHYIYFHPHDPRKEELFCYYKRDPGLEPNPSGCQCLDFQKLTIEQQMWMEAQCTITDSSSLRGLDENDKLAPTELRNLAERIINSSFEMLTHGHSKDSFSLDPNKHIKLCEELLKPHIPRHTYILDKIKVLHQSKTPSDLVAVALKEWQNISPSHTKQRLGELLLECGYYLESLKLDARLIHKPPISVSLSDRELATVSVHAAEKWKDLANRLKFKPAEIKAIKQSFPKTNRRKMECCLNCLETWRERLKPNEVVLSRGNLVECLRKISYPLLADLIEIGSDS